MREDFLVTSGDTSQARGRCAEVLCYPLTLMVTGVVGRSVYALPSEFATQQRKKTEPKLRFLDDGRAIQRRALPILRRVSARPFTHCLLCGLAAFIGCSGLLFK